MFIVIFLSLTFKLLTNLSQEFVRLGNTVSVNNTFFGQLGTLEKKINRKNYTLNFINNKNSSKLPYYTLNFINNIRKTVWCINSFHLDPLVGLSL